MRRPHGKLVRGDYRPQPIDHKGLLGLRKALRVKLRLLDGTTFTRTGKAAPRTLLNGIGVDDMLKQVADSIERDYPGREFRLVPLRDGSFNFVEVEAVAPEQVSEVSEV